MSTFSMMDIGRTGVGFTRYWMDQISHNLANVNTVRPAGEEPFRSRLVVAQSLSGGPYASTGSGVFVRELREHAGEAARTYDPANPLADAEGYVTQPVVEMGTQMTDLILANRSYQMNLKTIETGREAYQAALRIGQR
jgi:flagellar basal-body rod protein FlgC